MDKAHEKRIDYVAPKVADFGPLDALYGDINCETGNSANEQCNPSGSSAGTTCNAGFGAAY
jgi:hypothetical protein